MLELRHNDYTLDDDQEFLRSSFGSFFAKEVPTSRVRSAEPLGHDAELWADAAAIGLASMGLPERFGGGGAGPVDLVLVAEEFGRVLAPVPFIEHTVAGRLLSRCGAPLGPAAWGEITDGTRILSLALQPADRAPRQLVPAGAVTTTLVALDGNELVLLRASEPHPLVPNQGSTPLAWCDLTHPELDREVLAAGSKARKLFAAARAEWKLLMAAALVGLGDAALSLGTEFAKNRKTLGVPIGALQGVAFPLVDARILLTGASNLTRKAAWSFEHESGRRPELVAMASAYAARAANTAATVSVHVHGGIGVSLEADVTLFFRRAKGWPLVGGSVAEDVAAIARTLVGTPPAASEEKATR
jgi:alkylation response protein AidB-like acyl-CoA dehydrogenase